MTTIGIFIRRAETRDARAIAEIYNEAIAGTTATFDTEPKTERDRLEWLAAHDHRHPVLVAEREGEVVGWAALTKWSDRPAYDGTVESSFYVAHRHRGAGVGRRLKERLIDEARKAGFHSIISRIAQGNAASRHINEVFGFFYVGTLREVGFKFGQWLDVEIMQLMLGDATPRKSPPRETEL